MQRYFSNKKIDNSFILGDDDWYHIRKVMRLLDGQEVEVVYENRLFICKINDNLVSIEKEAKTNYKKSNITLLIPILQEQKMSFVLQKATELGVCEIVPILVSRSKVKVDEKEDKKLARWQRICKEASEQSKRLDIPKIQKIISLDDICFDGLKLVCSTKEDKNTLKKVLKKDSNCDKIVIAVGPEGGLTDFEEDKLIKKGFIPVSLGSNIMRVETVPIYLLSILNYEIME